MSDTRFIRAGNFIDGSTADMRRDVLLAVTGTIITAIGPAADLWRNDGAAIDDFSHCTIVPALVDCSISLSKSPAMGHSSELFTDTPGLVKKATLLARHIRYCHAHGVLGVAENDDISDLLEYDSKVVQPEGIINIRTCGGIYRSEQDCAAGSHPGGDFLKIGYSGNIANGETPYPSISFDSLNSMLQHRDEKKAVVLANGRQQVAEALAAGCDAIEQGYGMGEDNLKKMADQGVVWIPSILLAKNGLDAASSSGDVCCRFSTRYVAPGKPAPKAEIFWKRVLAEQLAQLRLARTLGVRTAVGTAAGSVGILHGESMAEEMKLFIKAGYSLEETIRCASENGAKFFGMEKLGALGVGRRATFLITRGTGQQLPRKLSYLEGIYVNGSPSTIYRKNPIMNA